LDLLFDRLLMIMMISVIVPKHNRSMGRFVSDWPCFRVYILDGSDIMFIWTSHSERHIGQGREGGRQNIYCSTDKISNMWIPTAVTSIHLNVMTYRIRWNFIFKFSHRNSGLVSTTERFTTQPVPTVWLCTVRKRKFLVCRTVRYAGRKHGPG